MKNHYFIADLHLSAKYLDRHKSFLSFCQIMASKKAQLYILGDLFDTWLGDDMMTTQEEQIAAALYAIKKSGGQVFFQAGNRDFLIGDDFLNLSGCVPIIAEEEVLQINNKRVFVAHGDSLCIADKKFQEVRAATRTQQWKQQFISKSSAERLKLKQQYFAESNAHVNSHDTEELCIHPEYIEKLFIKHDADILIHGHLHKPEQFELNIQGKKRQLICLGDWGNQNKAWVASITDKAELHNYPLDKIQII